MVTDPITGKYYSLKHKKVYGSIFSRGYILVTDVGVIDERIIFKTDQSDARWLWWDDFYYKYIGDIA